MQAIKQLLVLSLLAIPACAQITLIASTQSTGSGVSSPAINTTGATLFVCFAGSTSVSATCGDSQNNTWTALTVYGNTSKSKISYVCGPTTSSSQTFKVTTDVPSGVYYAYSGTKTSGCFASQNGNAGPNSSPFQPGSVTPNSVGDLVCTGASSDEHSFTGSINDSFSTPITNTNDINEVTAASCLVTSASGAVDPTWTMSANTDWTAAIAVFAVAPRASRTGAHGSSWF
jgi:hypothetical protein